MLPEILPRKTLTMFNPFDGPTEAESREALAQNLEARAELVMRAGEPVVQSFDNPSYHQLQADERSQADAIATFAGKRIWGVNSIDRLTNRQVIDLEGAAMYLVRRTSPDWQRAAREQAVEALLASDEFRALTFDRSPAEARVLAHRFAQTFRAAEIGVLENNCGVSASLYLRICAGQVRAGAR